MTGVEDEGELVLRHIDNNESKNIVSVADVKPNLYDEPIGLIAAITNDCHSESDLNHTSHETQTPLLPYDASGIPSIAGTSACTFRNHSSTGESTKNPLF